MRRQICVGIIIILLTFPVTTFSQNSSDTLNYYGTIKDLKINIKLSILSEQLDASVLLMSYNKNPSEFKFSVEKDEATTKQNLNFIHFSTNSTEFSDYFTIKGIGKDVMIFPSKLYGTYSFKDSKYKFVLIRKS